MVKKPLHIKLWLKYILSILIVSLFVLYPSFNLALTGDDYLGLWRYNETLAGRQPGPQTPLSYFFIDYGPQDMTTALIHSFVGWEAQYYYYASFILRFLATVSFLPLIYYLTRNRTASFLTAIFFAVCTTGLETTDWSFNMPSYLAIAFLNLFIITYFHARKTKHVIHIVLAILLFLLTIVVQPIRMAFLPIFVLGVELFSLLHTPSKKTLVSAIINIMLFLGAFLILLKTTAIGTQAGGVSQGNSLFAHYTKGLSELLAQRDFEKLLSPVAQVGSVIIPDTSYPLRFNTYSEQKFFSIVLIPTLVLYLLFFGIVRRVFSLQKTKVYSFTKVSLLLWTAILFYLYKVAPQYPLQNNQLLSYLIGGYFIVTLLFLIISYWKQKQSLLFFTPVLLLFLSFIIPWLRNPGSINPTVGRYLIVSAAGFAFLLGILLAYSKHKRAFIIVFFTPLFLIHLFSSKSYINHLSSVRGYENTEKIRSTLTINKSLDVQKSPMIYYFQTDHEETLYHSIMFGFPMVMKYYHNVQNPWNIAYTTSWKEVYDAHTTGESLRRFGTISSISPVPIENIYGYKIESGELRDMTEETRKKLLEETKVIQQP